MFLLIYLFTVQYLFVNSVSSFDTHTHTLLKCVFPAWAHLYACGFPRPRLWNAAGRDSSIRSFSASGVGLERQQCLLFTPHLPLQPRRRSGAQAPLHRRLQQGWVAHFHPSANFPKCHGNLRFVFSPMLCNPWGCSTSLSNVIINVELLYRSSVSLDMRELWNHLLCFCALGESPV